MNIQIAPSLLALALIAGSQTFPSSSLAASPPTNDLALWLKADTGLVTQQPQTVSGWLDQAPGGTHGGTSVGAPILTQASFPNGPHPVIRFNGASGFNLDNDADLELASLSVFAVVSVNNAVASEIFIGHFKPTFGWALGISDSTAGRVKWFTAPPQSMEPAAGSLSNNVPTLLTGTFGGGTKELFVNGSLADTLGGMSLDYGGGGGALTVGYLGPIGQYLQGDIAELLVFNSADAFQRAEVEAYLNAKYFQPNPPADNAPPTNGMVLWLRADAGVNTEQPVLVFDWADQAPGGGHNGTSIGTPTLAQASFPNGSHPVIRFNRASGFNLDNDAGLELASLSVFAVASINNTVAAEIFIGHFKPTFGWALGVSDSTAGRVKWFTAPPQSMEPAAGSLSNNVPTLLTGTFGGGTKELFVNGSLADTLGGMSLDYGGGGGALTVGYLGSIGQYLEGDIAELLVFNSADAFQRAEVEAYLSAKYFQPNPPADNAPPTNGMVLWLRADAGVNTQQPVPVYGWTDQAPGGLRSGTSVGVPTLAQAVFTNGSHSVVRFGGSSGFNLDGGAGLEWQDFSIYAVLSVDNSVSAQVFVGNYRDVAGWVLGISDGTAGLVKWFTAPPQSLEPAGGALAQHVPTLLTATRTSSGIKTLYVNSTQAGTVSDLPPIPYGGEQLTLGYLQGNRQFMQGDIAEVLVYSATSESQRTAVEAYLNEKYFTVPQPSLAIRRVVLPGGAGVRISWPQATGTGFTLQFARELPATTWTDIGQGTAQDDQFVVEELVPDSPGSMKFYRLHKP